MSNKPLVSICLPNLNNRPYLEARIESLLAQTLTDWELIVVDNYSDDGAWEFLQKLRHNERIKISQAPRAGMYANWNNCLRQAQGRYVYVATSDDTCDAKLLEKMVAALENAKATGNRESLVDKKHDRKGSTIGNEREYPPLPADIAVCNFDYIDQHGDVIDPPLPPAGAFYGDDRYRAHRRSGYLEFLVHLLVGTSWTTMTAVLFRRSLLNRTGLFDASVPGALADRLWAYRSALASDTIVVPETLATWRQHACQGSAAHADLRTVSQMRDRRALWRAIKSTIYACESTFPPRWKQISDLKSKLLWSERRHYYDLYHLDRTSLRYKPKLFFSGMAKAIYLEPEFLAHRLMHGLKWEHDVAKTEYAYALDLIRELDIPLF